MAVFGSVVVAVVRVEAPHECYHSRVAVVLVGWEGGVVVVVMMAAAMVILFWLACGEIRLFACKSGPDSTQESSV